MLSKTKRPGAGDAGPLEDIKEVVGNTPNLTPHQSPDQDPKPAPPITRSRCWEDYDTKAFSCDRDKLAGNLNHELAKAINQAMRYVDQSDPDQLDSYLACHSELFSLLDTVYLLMKEMDVTDAQAKAVAGATRKHVHRAMARWRLHQLELMEEALAFYDAVEPTIVGPNKPPPEPPPKRKPASWFSAGFATAEVWKLFGVLPFGFLDHLAAA